MDDSAYFVKSTLTAFTRSFQHCRYSTDILKMCRKKFDAEKIFFDKLTGILYPATQKVAGYYVIHSENFECPSICLSVHTHPQVHKGLDFRWFVMYFK